MSYLLAKIFLLLVLAAVLGALLARWWLRRHYEDVTGEYLHMNEQWQRWRAAFEEKLAARPTVDLQPLSSRMEALESSVRAINIPKPVATDLAPVLAAVAAIRMPTIPAVDLAPLHARIGEVDAAVKAIRIPTMPVMPTLDLAPLQSRLDALERAVRAIVIPSATHVDMQPVMDMLASLKASVAASVGASVASAASAAAPVHAPAPAPAPVPARVSAPATKSAAVRAGSRNLLTHAAHGTPDDLQLIKGVAEVLEKMMHGIGVYYFWQIAEWTSTDVVHADAQLTAFKGRITRDSWVAQSMVLARRADSAKHPGA